MTSRARQTLICMGAVMVAALLIKAWGCDGPTSKKETPPKRGHLAIFTFAGGAGIDGRPRMIASFMSVTKT